MKKSIILTFALLALGACKGSGNNGNGDKGDMAGNNNGGGNFSVLSATVTLAAGQGGCANGGVQVNIGLDNGDGGGVARDGTLQDGEIDTNKVVCNGSASSFNTVTLQTPVGLGDMHCMFGGTRIDYGLDNGEGGGTAGNGTLETGEIDGTAYACLAKPANELVVTTPLYPGDPQCQFGGQLVSVGLDDGQPGGTADDGKLDIGEVDSTKPHCNPPPTDTFPAPTGNAGTAKIDVAGGAGLGTGAGGRGGSIQLGTYGGPVPISVEAYKAGAVTPNTTVVKPTFAAGAHPIEIDADTSIEMAESAQEGLHFRLNLAVPFGTSLYDGDVLVTSVHVQAGKTLTIVNPGIDTDLHVQVQGDIRNEGTITALYDTGDGMVATDLEIECHHFINEATGVVDMRATQSFDRAGLLAIWAVYGTGGEIYNEVGGVLRADARDGSDDAGPSYSNALSLTAAGNVFNGGQVLVNGGDDNSDSNNTASAGDILVRTLHGNIVNTGLLDAHGARGEGGAGGTVIVANGVSGLGLPNHPALSDAKIYGPGSYNGTGTIDVSAGINNQNSFVADGGTAVIRMLGGSVTTTTTITANGGGYKNAIAQTTGQGGTIFIGAFAWVGLDGELPPVIPDAVTVGGNLTARGGTSETGLAQGGTGGNVYIKVDLVLAGQNAKAVRGTSYDVATQYPTAQLNAFTKPVRLQLLGYGGNFHAEGGASGWQGGDGGYVYFNNDVCTSSLPQCAFTHVGQRLISTSVDVFMNGGNGDGSNGGGGGEIDYRMYGNYNAYPATLDAAQILVAGKLVGLGGAGDHRQNYAGYVDVECDSCDVVVSGDVTLTGGATTQDSEGTDYGGWGGELDIYAFSATVTANLDVMGGVGLDRLGGGGSFWVGVYQATLSGKVSGNSGYVQLTCGLQCTSTSEIDLASANDNDDGGEFDARGTRFINQGMISVRGNSGAQYGSGGGSVYVNVAAFDNAGTVDASGGDASAPGLGNGGSGGYISINATSGSLTGSVLARGGSGTGTSGDSAAAGGDGGTINCSEPNNGTIDVSGGDASASGAENGGYGGTVTLYADNAAKVDAMGGAGSSSGGNGGTVNFDGATNTGCVDVSGGASTGTPGVEGEITPAGLPNMCGG